MPQAITLMTAIADCTIHQDLAGGGLSNSGACQQPRRVCHAAYWRVLIADNTQTSRTKPFISVSLASMPPRFIHTHASLIHLITLP